MPTYEFRCPSCRVEYERVSPVADLAKLRVWCEDCQQFMIRVFSPVGIIFKGGGWAGKVNHGTHKTSEKQPTASVKPEGDQSTAGDPAS